MDMRDEPNFTGSSTTFGPNLRFTVAVPAIVKVKQVNCYTGGRITRTYYDWSVEVLGRQIAYRDEFKPFPRTAKAAARQGQKAARAWATAQALQQREP